MQQNEQTKRYDYHVMTCHDTSHEGINIPITCHDSEQSRNTLQLENQTENRISKDEWLFLVETLDKWHVFNPRAVVKKNPAAAWKVMNLCKDKGVRVPGAYFTACFRTELARAEFKKELQKRIGAA